MSLSSRLGCVLVWCACGWMIGALASPVRSALGEDWGQFGGPNRNFRVTATASPPAGAIQAWRVNVQGGDDPPIVVGDRVIVSEIDHADDGTEAHRVTCRRLDDGHLLWSRVFPERSYASQDIIERYPVRPLASACVAGDRIVAVGFGGSVRCLRSTDGELLWSHDLVDAFNAAPIQYGYASAPWTDGKQVVVACGGPQALLLSFDVGTGDLLWKTGSGPASYASIVELEVPAPSSPRSHLVYAAGDALVGVEAATGKLLWQYDYPNKGLTNAVTPIAIAPGTLVVAGQGIGGSKALRIESAADGRFDVSELWANGKINPFYCNWVHLPAEGIIAGFAGKTLFAIDGRSGTTLWQKRGWTDANLTVIDDDVYVLRGDGVVARTHIDRTGIRVLNAVAATVDRVWAPLVVSRGRYLIRGRTSLTSDALNALPQADAVPDGTVTTAMDAMYGEPDERVAELIRRAGATPAPLTWEEYLVVADDASLEIGQGTSQKVIEALLDRDDLPLALRIATDWHQRMPDSIEAWERWTDLLERSGDAERAAREREQRMIDVAFEFEIPPASPDGPPAGSGVVVFGNAKALGNGNGDGLVLERVSDTVVRGTAVIPRGDLRFKLALGARDRVEVRADDRPISNRRQRLRGPTVIRGKVAKWKSPS